MKIAYIVYDEQSQSLRFMSPDDDAPPHVVGDVPLSGVVADDVDDLSSRVGRLVLGLLENAIGDSPFNDYSFGKELDEPKLRRIENLSRRAQQGNPDALFEIFNIYFAVAVRSFDEAAFLQAEQHLNRAVESGSKRASEYARNEWPQVRQMSLAHIRRRGGLST
jgi:hypothetical protein